MEPDQAARSAPPRSTRVRSSRLSFPGDTFTKRGYRARLEGWQANVRAVALGLEALRKVERYRIANTGEQYTGWKQLGGGTPMPAAAMTVEEAARFIARVGWPNEPDAKQEKWFGRIIDEPAFRAKCFRDAAKRVHPVVAGDPGTFRRLVAARDLLAARQCAGSGSA